jgi:hypothetical protein
MAMICQLTSPPRITSDQSLTFDHKGICAGKELQVWSGKYKFRPQLNYKLRTVIVVTPDLIWLVYKQSEVCTV